MISISALCIGATIFAVLYQGIGMLLDNRKMSRQSPWRQSEAASLGKSARGVLERTGEFGFNKSILKIKGLKPKWDKLLLYSGNPLGWKAETLLVMKEALMIGGGLFAWYTDQGLLLGIGIVVVCYKLPDLYLISKANARRGEIQRMLTGYIDLLTLTMEGGMDLLAASERIIQKMRPNALKEELTILLQENRLGTPRKESFLHLSERVNLSDLHSMTSMIIQSEEMGTSLASVLRSYAEDMRSKRILRAEEAAGQAPVKLLFPMMVFFFPIVFIIIFGPLAYNFYTSGGFK